MTAGLTSPQGGEEPRGVVKKWISGALLCTETTKMEESEDAHRQASETKWEAQLQVWGKGAEKTGRKFQINTRYQLDEKEDKIWQ